MFVIRFSTGLKGDYTFAQQEPPQGGDSLKGFAVKIGIHYFNRQIIVTEKT
jgi:hypothetical protein